MAWLDLGKDGTIISYLLTLVKKSYAGTPFLMSTFSLCKEWAADNWLPFSSCHFLGLEEEILFWKDQCFVLCVVMWCNGAERREQILKTKLEKCPDRLLGQVPSWGGGRRAKSLAGVPVSLS